jgi:radical SAM superfamily enzyme YgiQ (UPF0313 family)
MNVLLISANSLRAPYPVYPLGLDHVARAIGGEHDVRLADLNTIDLDCGLPDLIDAFRPDVTDPKGFVGLHQRGIDTVRAHTSAPVVLGGSGFTLFPAEMMNILGADFGIIGEGERLTLLLAVLAAGGNPAHIPGVIVRGGRGQAPDPWEGPFGSDPCNGARHLGFYLQRGAILNLQTKRGCPFRCVYCTYPQIEGHRLRRVPPAEAARCAIALQRSGAKFIFVTDSAFNADYDHSAAVAREFRAAGISIPWGAFFSPTPHPADYYRQLADAGLSHVEFGTESLSDRVLAAYRKPFRARHVFASHRAALDAGIYVAHYFLLGGPGETPVTLTETLSHVDNLAKSVLFFFCGMRIYPDTALFRMACNCGQIAREQSLLSPIFYQPDDISLDGIVSAVARHADGRPNWVVGAGGEKTAEIIARMHRKGFHGPLWEYLIR